MWHAALFTYIQKLQLSLKNVLYFNHRKHQPACQWLYKLKFFPPWCCETLSVKCIFMPLNAEMMLCSPLLYWQLMHSFTLLKILLPCIPSLMLSLCESASKTVNMCHHGRKPDPVGQQKQQLPSLSFKFSFSTRISSIRDCTGPCCHAAFGQHKELQVIQ